MASVTSLLAFTVPTQVISAAAQAQVLAQIDVVRNAIPDPTTGRSATHPDWDQMHPRMAEQLRAELAALKAAIDAAPAM